MKKSLKKACSLTLAVTTSAVAGAALMNLSNMNTNNLEVGNVYAATAQNFTSIEIEKYNETAIIGDSYSIPKAAIVDTLGARVELGDDNVKVYDSSMILIDVEGGHFDVEYSGTYTITYSYDVAGKNYSASIKVNAEIASTTMQVKENETAVLPAYAYVGYKDGISIPEAELVFADESDEIAVDISTTIYAPDGTEVAMDADRKLDSAHTLQKGRYRVVYVAESDKGVYLNSMEKTFEVLEDAEFEKNYGGLAGEYTLKFSSYTSTAPTTANIGEELALPAPVGKVKDEEVEVSYTLTVELVLDDNKTLDVTAETLKDNNKFTAQKSYTIGGKDYSGINATYRIKYAVEDGLGTKAEERYLTLTKVNDITAPEIIVTNAYDKETISSDVENQDYLQQKYFNHGENVIIKAIYAKDNADDEVTLSRTIQKIETSSSRPLIYSDTTEGNESNVNKDLVINLNGTLDADTQIDITSDIDEYYLDNGKLEDGDYSVTYKAEDKSGNIKTVVYEFTVDSSFEFTGEPEIEFSDVFKKSINFGDVVTFSAPNAYYEAEVDGATKTVDSRLNTYVEYSFDNGLTWELLDKDQKTNLYSIKADVEGATKLQIKGTTQADGNKTKSEIIDIDILDITDVDMPVIVNLGDAAINLEQNTEITVPSITVSDSLIDYVDVMVDVNYVDTTDNSKLPIKTYNFYSIVAGNTKELNSVKFFANLVGTYEIEYTIKDAANRTIKVFKSLDVAAATAVDEVQFSNLPSSLVDGTLELGEKIEMPTAVVKGSVAGYTELDYTVWVKSGHATINKQTFTPSEVGTYKIVYTVIDKATGHAVKVGGKEITKEFIVEVEDTTAPVVTVANQVGSYKKGDKFNIAKLQATDAAGIDFLKSKIVVSNDKGLSFTINGDEFAEEYAKFLNNQTGKFVFTFEDDATYKISYYAYDNNGNLTVDDSLKINIGDTEAPKVDVSSDIITKTYKIGDIVDIDFSKIEISDNLTEFENKNDVKVVLKNTTTGEVLVNCYSYENDKTKVGFEIKTAGEYTLSISVKDKAGYTSNVYTETFTISAESVGSVNADEIIVTVLIVASVLVLGGVIVYFIVSKKKLDKIYK